MVIVARTYGAVLIKVVDDVYGMAGATGNNRDSETILLVSVCQYRFYVEITWKKSVREVSEREM